MGAMGDVLVYFQAQLFVAYIAVGVLIFWSAVWALHIIGISYGSWRLHRRRRGPLKREEAPPISIIKPLVGIDSNLGANLETFFTMKYPGDYELLFCLHSDRDPAGMIVDSLMGKYPSVPARVFRSPLNVGVNPKINNMAAAYAEAKHELILISDSGLRMKEDTLEDMVAAMTEKVGLVSQMPYVCDRSGGFPATLEKVFFGTWQARMYLSADLIGFICCTGMSCLIRKSILEDVGGLAKFGAYIAEDQFIAKAVHKKGYRLAVASQPAWQNPGQVSVARFHSRVARWAKLRIAMMPHCIPVEPMQDCVLLGLAASWAASLLLSWSALVVLLVHCLAWMLLDYVLLSVVQASPMPFGKLEFALTWIYREVTAFPIFLYALLNPDIAWRESGTYRLNWGGRARKIRDGLGRPIPPEQQYGPPSAEQPLLPSTTPPETSIVISSVPSVSSASSSSSATTTTSSSSSSSGLKAFFLRHSRASSEPPPSLLLSAPSRATLTPL